jgi:ATP-dependent helicase/nuclease subunit A
MTRAADRLIVAGIKPGNVNTIRKLCWYNLADTGLAASGLQEEILDTDDGAIRRYTRPEDGAHTGGAITAAASAPLALPSWLRTPLPHRSTAADLLRPSDAGGNKADGNKARRIKSSEAVEQRSRALQRGTLVHRLLQSLPDVAPARRRDAALNFLHRNASDWTGGEQDALAANVLALIGDVRFAAVFADGSRAEVPVVGRLDRPGGAPVTVSGQVDRLVVTENEILIVDFKTNQAPPASAAQAPAAYVRQLALYRALLAKLYPQKPIRAALLWTETPELMEISASSLDAELASIGGGTPKLDPARVRS